MTRTRLLAWPFRARTCVQRQTIPDADRLPEDEDGEASGLAYGSIATMIFVVALALRVWRAQLPDDTVYADDIFQMLEPAHRLVFGYGYIAWEFVAGVRNWLLPGTLALVLGGLSRIGLDQPETYGPAITGLSILISLFPIEVARRTAHLIGGSRAGLFAAAAAAIYPPLLFAAQKITPEILAGYILPAAILFALRTSRGSAAASGLLCGFVAGLRIHYAPALLVVAWIIFVRRHKDWTSVRSAVAFGAVSFSLFGLVDWWTWGAPFVSYLRAIEVNILYGVASYFGEMPFYFYIAMFPFGIGLALISVLDWPRTRWLLLPVAAILLVHTLIGHKEPRFVFAIHLLTVTAIAIPLAKWTRKGAERRLLAFAVCLCSVVMCAKSYLMPSRPEALLAADYRLAIAELRGQSDMRALATYGVGLYNFPGAFWLHRNIPIVHDDEIPSTSIPPGITHAVVIAGAPVTDGFETIRTYGRLEVRKRINIDQEAVLPPVDWSMPAIFSW